MNPIPETSMAGCKKYFSYVQCTLALQKNAISFLYLDTTTSTINLGLLRLFEKVALCHASSAS